MINTANILFKGGIMKENEQNEFDLLPSEAEVKMMNKEYNELLRRKNMVENDIIKAPNMCDNLNNNTKCESSISLNYATMKTASNKKIDITEKATFERIYYAEKDMIMALKQLFSIAPNDTKDDIADIIKLKKSNCNSILKCYYKKGDEVLNYSPIISHDHDYCRLLKRISNIQKHILLMLTKTKLVCPFTKKITAQEWTASYILSSIGIFCKF